MKSLILLLVAILLGVASALAAPALPTTGHVVNAEGKVIEYATVVLLQGEQQVAGMVTDTNGRFKLEVPAGTYTLSVQYLGLESVQREVHITAATDLGEILLQNSATAIAGVEVKGQLIRREADRFVVDVANAPSAIGKDGIELIERAPGVWLDGDKITINGKSGSKVFINDRELRMETDQLLNYLRTLTAEQIQKIEIIPTVGADQDANSAGGAIRITLRKRRENGVDGSVSLRTDQSDLTHTYNTSANINVHSGKLDFYGSASGYFGSGRFISDEQTRYTSSATQILSNASATGLHRNFGTSFGAIYELNPRHTIGAEFEYRRENQPSKNHSLTDFTIGDALTRTTSNNRDFSSQNHYAATFNYIWKIDTLGSTFKLLADYTNRAQGNKTNNRSLIVTPTEQLDSLYRDRVTNRYNIVSTTLALEKVFSPRWSLQAGVKYTYNDMRNNALYEYSKADVWLRDDSQSFTINYTEHIAAGYAVATAKLGRWNLVGGLRGEYTHTLGKGSDVEQNYFSLFPNANISYSLSKDGAYSLIGQYARTIQRPNFWQLSPQRQRISDYSYQSGNPALDPTYSHYINLTLVLAYKYTLMAGVSFNRGEIQENMQADPENPNLLFIRPINYDPTKRYFISANAPVQITKWWQANAGLTYMSYSTRLTQHAPAVFQHALFLNLSTTFNLPAKFFIDISFDRISRVQVGNLSVAPDNRLKAGLKKRFGERFTCFFSVENILNQPQRITTIGDGFTRNISIKQAWNNTTYKFGVTYNFKSGKAFKNRSVEASDASEKSRL